MLKTVISPEHPPLEDKARPKTNQTTTITITVKENVSHKLSGREEEENLKSNYGPTHLTLITFC